ncbi:MAG: TonB-dependent receptor, partial [Pseudomonas sp.]|nr:TonB-dependent receptor [Pseudomonas sp.]
MRTPKLRLNLLASSLLLGLSSMVQAANEVDFDLPAAPLEQSPNALAGQSAAQILFSSDIASDKQAGELRGRYSTGEALQRLLEDSGLEVHQQGEDTFIIVSREAALSQAPSAAPLQLGAMDVTATRTSSSLVPQVRQVDVIEREKLEQLRQGSDSLATLLAKVTPGMSDSSRTITDYGQTLRGRTMLILVDGVPLNTNRDSSRNLASIDPALIERVEVVHGSSAIYGAGATGGIVNITTRPAGGESRAETTLRGSSSLTQLDSDSLGGELQHHLSGAQGKVDYAFDLGVRHVGGSFDADGKRIAPEPSQGDLFDSNSFNIGGKLGLRIDEDQRIQLALSHSDAKQDSDYTADPAVATLPAGSVPAQPLKGLKLDTQNRIKNTLANLQYDHADLLGSRLSAQLYYRDYFT